MMKALACLVCLTLFLPVFAQKQIAQSFYQISVYHYKDSSQEKTINQYLQNALLPALHRMNIKPVGVFTSLSNDTSADKKMYVLMPVKSLDEIASLSSKLNGDKAYTTAGKEYLTAAFNAAPYTRMETILLQAFPLAPTIQQPQLKSPNKNRVYELRSYEGPTEQFHASKVKMFNVGDEVGIFKHLNFNPVFYAEVLAGSHQPNLMYMTTFENMPDREEHWKQFMNSEAFKKLLQMPEYDHNVSKADIIFLRPADYSDL
ncbi:MAG: NIPSNAP family protein [Bacteroidota bacterium]|nr:NIPSNAP family protein [Bacteroidota bacterium]